MLKIGRLLLMILCLAASPVLAADMCPVNTKATHTASIVKQDGKQQTDEHLKGSHNCCHHQLAARAPYAVVLHGSPNIKKHLIFSDRICCTFGERPPLEPPVRA
jgi:hypothetical protein